MDTQKIEIPLQEQHVCSDSCKTTLIHREISADDKLGLPPGLAEMMGMMIGCFEPGPNPNWDPNTQTCDKSGNIQNSCIYIASYDSNESDIMNLNDLVITDNEFKIKFSYPLSKEAVFTFQNKNGFTRKDVIQHIVDTYRRIYQEEDESLTETAPTTPGMLNRGATNGKWGIWGHDIGDLVIERLTYYPDKKILDMFIGS